jgi:putative Holliday junction resolvase
VRILAVDFGDKRVGIAVCDVTESATRALPTIPRRSDVQAAADVAARAAAEGAEWIVVGLPLNMDGTEGAAAARARRFAERVAQRTDVVVTLADERRTTVEAERKLLNLDVGRARRRQRRDAVAAALLLESVLEERRAAHGRASDGGGIPHG